jgi:hypothetical protein
MFYFFPNISLSEENVNKMIKREVGITCTFGHATVVGAGAKKTKI